MSALWLGQQTPIPEGYAPHLLTPIPRAEGRRALGEPLPRWVGEDRWFGYECSWLDRSGRPQSAVIEIRVPADSPLLIESKSLKLYLHGFNQSCWDSPEALRHCIAADLSAAAGAPVTVLLHPPDRFVREVAWDFADPEALLLDTLPVARPPYDYDPQALALLGEEVVEQRFVMGNFRSLCPVTHQPDWASIYLRLLGPRVDPAALFRYLVSFRRHAGFHEQCVETIFTDLVRLGVTPLLVWGRFLRRGGLEINPVRAAAAEWLPARWLADPRQ